MLVAAARLLSCRPKRRTRRAGTPADKPVRLGPALPVWETGARVGKARITSLAIFRFLPS